MGAGTTAVAAVRTGRRYIGFDTDVAYIELAEQRIDDERQGLTGRSDELNWAVTVPPSSRRNGEQQFFVDLDESTVSPNGSSTHAAGTPNPGGMDDFQARAGREGRRGPSDGQGDPAPVRLPKH